MINSVNQYRIDRSQFRLEISKNETESQESKVSTLTTTTSEKALPSAVHHHQRVHSLRLGARQVEDNGGLSGQTFPYLPRGPSLFRETSEDGAIEPQRQRSPLQHLALTNQIPHAYLQRIRDNLRRAHENLPLTSVMPHAVSVAQSGFQALILCGPGIGLSTFTNLPKDYPKALVPIANRPMIWYALEWCYRMGVTDITIITPPASKTALEAALGQNPDLTTLPSPKPDLLAPADLEFNTPTAELLRLPEVQSVIKSDFLLLPCDLICDISGDILLESYLTSMAGIAGTGASDDDSTSRKSRNNFALGAEASGRRGGLSVWYNTVNREESVKKEECDFMATVPLDPQHSTPVQKIAGLPNGSLRKLVLTTPMSELLEDVEENKSWKVRQSLLREYGAVKCMTQYRDSHIYFFPYWVKDFAATNQSFESVSEDLVGAWAKSEWRKQAYRTRIGATTIFKAKPGIVNSDSDYRAPPTDSIEDGIDLLSLSSTQITQPGPRATQLKATCPMSFASRVQGINPEDSIISTTTDNSSTNNDTDNPPTIPYFPPILSYILPSTPTAPLVRRVDSTPLLLSVSILLAKLPPSDQPNATPLSHPSKIHQTSQPAQGVRVNVSTIDSLVASNTTLSQYCNVKQSCIGSNCFIGPGARIQGCVIMDGAWIGEKAVLSGSVIGKKARIEKGVVLKDCEVQDEKHVPEGTEAKGEKMLVGGLEDGDEEFGTGNMDEDDDDDVAL